MKKIALFILAASMLCGTAAAREWYEGGTSARCLLLQHGTFAVGAVTAFIVARQSIALTGGDLPLT